VAVLGLPNALASLCAAFAGQTGVEIDFVHDEIPPLPAEISTCLYRVAQEAIQNATKHSDSRDIVVKLTATADAIHLSVADSGRGFDQAGTGYNAGLGLVSMAERARSMGGRLTVRSAANQGTRIEASIPLR
jgi:signal transduction histidine kinase